MTTPAVSAWLIRGGFSRIGIRKGVGEDKVIRHNKADPSATDSRTQTIRFYAHSLIIQPELVTIATFQKNFFSLF